MTDPERPTGQVIDVEPERPAADQAVTRYREHAAANPFDADPATFSQQIAQRGENYAALVNWLADTMVIGHDLVQVHYVKRSNCNQGGPPRCTPTIEPYHWSDPDISKAGAEKICGLLGLVPRFVGMQDFRRQALRGATLEDVIIDCELVGAREQVVSQGTGSASRSEFDGNLNRAMKAAAKRAHIDAVKRCAGLSGLATEVKRRMPPVDPEQLDKQASDAQARARHTGAGAGRWNTGAALTICPIGKHKDKPWRELPGDYLEWAAREWADKPDLARAVAGELSKRRDSAAGSGSIRTQPSPDTSDQAPPAPPQENFDDDIPF